MNSIRSGQIVLGLILGVALGAGGMWRFTRSAAHSHLTDSSAAHVEDECEQEHADEHGHDHEDEHADGPLLLSDQAVRDNGIEVVAAAGGEIELTLTLPGEIVLNADRVAHIVPRVAGIVRRVDKNLGDEVAAGEVMAVLESRELAEVKAAYLAAQQRLALAEANQKSAAELHAKKIMPDLEFLTIEKARAEAEIEFQAAANKLHALGVTELRLQDTATQATSLVLYELQAPFAGTVVDKHCALGEVLDSTTDAFVLADLSTVWATISVYPQDVPRIRVGQPVRFRAAGDDATATGTISYLSPVANETSRTVSARVDLPNADRRWRPGMFVTATISLDRVPVPVLVPRAALQRVKGAPVVFVAEGAGFEPRAVSMGRENGTCVEIVDGLRPGERYAAQGAVMLKAELGKREAVHEH